MLVGFTGLIQPSWFGWLCIYEGCQFVGSEVGHGLPTEVRSWPCLFKDSVMVKLDCQHEQSKKYPPGLVKHTCVCVCDGTSGDRTQEEL